MILLLHYYKSVCIHHYSYDPTTALSTKYWLDYSYYYCCTEYHNHNLSGHVQESMCAQERRTVVVVEYLLLEERRTVVVSLRVVSFYHREWYPEKVASVINQCCLMFLLLVPPTFFLTKKLKNDRNRYNRVSTWQNHSHDCSLCFLLAALLVLLVKPSVLFFFVRLEIPSGRWLPQRLRKLA